MFDFLKDKKFLISAITLAIPVALQNIINNGINLIDTLMVSTLDAVSVAAVGQCNNVFFLWNTCSFGIISGAMILTSQFYGAKKYVPLRRTFGLTIIVDFLASLIWFIPCQFFTPYVLKIVTNDPKVITEGIKYLKIVCLMYPMQAFTLTTLLILRSFGNVKIPIFSSIVTLLTNMSLNYLLINGHFGFPALGVTGAAIATIIGRLVETIILISYLFLSKSFLVEKIKDLFSFFEKDYLLLYFKNVAATFADELFYGLSMFMCTVAYGRLVSEQVSAMSIVSSIWDMLVTFYIGFCSASSVILGIELGKNNIDKAKLYAKYFIKLMIFVGIVIGIFTFFARGMFESWFINLGTEVIYYVDKLLIIVPIAMLVGGQSFIYLVGILRAGGDSRVCAYIDLFTGWLIGVPLAFLSVLVWKFPIHITFLIVNLQEVGKALFGYLRYRQFKWAKNIVKNID